MPVVNQIAEWLLRMMAAPYRRRKQTVLGGRISPVYWAELERRKLGLHLASSILENLFRSGKPPKARWRMRWRDFDNEDA